MAIIEYDGVKFESSSVSEEAANSCRKLLDEMISKRQNMTKGDTTCNVKDKEQSSI